MNELTALMLVDDMAMKLALFPEQAIDESGCSPTIAAGIRAAREAFSQHVSEADIEVLRREMYGDIRSGLREFDAARKVKT